MSDEPVPEVPPESGNPDSPPPRTKRSYSDDDKYIALAAVKLNGGNVYRTAIALDIPCATLQDWVEKYDKHELSFSQNPISRERRGSLAAKLEDKVHSLVESIDDRVIKKATLSQRFVGIGIGIDKLRLLLGQGLEPDPATELCKLLQCNRSELPDRLQLQPGEELPPGFGFSGEIIEAETVEPQPISEPIYHPHAQDCPFTRPRIPGDNTDYNASSRCNCGAYDLNEHEELAFAQSKLIQDEGVNLTQDGSPTPPEDVTDGDAKLLEGIDDDDSAN